MMNPSEISTVRESVNELREDALFHVLDLVDFAGEEAVVVGVIYSPFAKEIQYVLVAPSLETATVGESSLRLIERC